MCFSPSRRTFQLISLRVSIASLATGKQTNAYQINKLSAYSSYGMKTIAIAASGLLLLTAVLVGCHNSDDTTVTPSTPGGTSTSTVSGTSSSITSLLSATATTGSVTGGLAQVVALAEAFKATLSSTQLAALQRSYSKTDAQKWSNLPAADVPRVGINLGALSPTQLAAFQNLMSSVLALNVTNEGYDEMLGDLVADDYLGTVNKATTYGAGYYYVAFLGTPSTSGLWEMHFTGHHYTQPYVFNAGQLTGVTPAFRGVEPMAALTANNRTYQPIEQERQVFATLLTGLSSSEQATAKLSSTFSDLVLGPGQDGKFPVTKVGLPVGSLSADKQALVLNAIKLYVNDLEPSMATGILAKYTTELANTYVAYSGTTSVTSQNDYIRIDGPSVWIEFSYQHGAVIQGTPHPHSVWRDHTGDYGGN